jgi:hypothetical protein
MKSKIIGLLSVAVAVWMVSVSCTHKPYHPTKSEREWTIDHEACEVWVREGIRDEPDTYDNFDEMRLIRRCMKEKGWQWERTDLFNFKKPEAE